MPHILDLEKQFEEWWGRYGCNFPWLWKDEARRNFIRQRQEWETYRKEHKYDDKANG